MTISVAALIVQLFAQQPATFEAAQKERAIEHRLCSEIRQSFPPFGNSAVDAYTRRVGARLIAHTDYRASPYSFETVVSSDVLEPLSLPGGCILVPARFFLAVRDEAEFAGMLAHAIAHTALRQTSRVAANGNVGTIPLVFMGPWLGLHVDSRQPSPTIMPVAFQSIQRERELEADRFGLQLVARAGYDPMGTRRYIDRMQAADSNMSALPSRDVRLAGMDEILKSLPVNSGPSTGEFEMIQSTVRETLDQAATKRPSLRR